MTLVIGKTSFPVNVIQGPLAGVSTAPFRKLAWKYGQPAFTCTEMISCKTLIYQPETTYQRYIKKDPEEGAVCFQLAGNDPIELAEAVKRVTQYGADLIDLNCGCPVKKIRSKGYGSRLLTNSSQLYQLICAMKHNTHVPVSIKIRVEHPDEKFNQEICQVVRDAGADFITVHGRHWTEHYETPCRHDEIAFFVSELDIPVIGNGDVACVDSYKKMLATGCAGVMIGRAGVGQPWLTKKILTCMRGENYSVPSPVLIGQMLIEHVIGLIDLLGSEKFAILQSRKIAKYYARTLQNRSEFCDAINNCENFAAFEFVCARYFI